MSSCLAHPFVVEMPRIQQTLLVEQGSYDPQDASQDLLMRNRPNRPYTAPYSLKAGCHTPVSVLHF
jgi:hypothetical protein